MLGLDNDQLVYGLYLVALLAFLLGGVGFRRGQRGARLGQLAVWIMLGLVLVGVYAYRAPLLQFAAPVLRELNPSRYVQVVESEEGSELTIRRGADGHFHVEADVNGVPVRFLVDTGASTTVLTVDDAERSGIDITTLEFNRPVQTANGMTFFARVALDSLEIGPYRLDDVVVGVMPDTALTTSLLGMNTINRFAGWSVTGDQMVLMP